MGMHVYEHTLTVRGEWHVGMFVPIVCHCLQCHSNTNCPVFSTCSSPRCPSKPTATLSLLHAVVPNAAARPTATPSEDDGKLDGDDGSVDVVAIKWNLKPYKIEPRILVFRRIRWYYISMWAAQRWSNFHHTTSGEGDMPHPASL